MTLNPRSWSTICPGVWLIDNDIIEDECCPDDNGLEGMEYYSLIRSDKKIIYPVYQALVLPLRTEGLYSTRLETRTKESSSHASVWVENSNAQ